jgi:hypothetical protein
VLKSLTLLNYIRFFLMRDYIKYLILITVLTFNLSNSDAEQRFRPYYPKDCTMHNSSAGITGTCICIQDIVTKHVWLVKPDDEHNPDWYTASAWADSLNSSGTCGFTNGWHLPSLKQIITMSRYMKDIPAGEKYMWFDDNGFDGIDQLGFYWSDTPYFIDSGHSAYLMVMYFGLPGKNAKSYLEPDVNYYGWAVVSF